MAQQRSQQTLEAQQEYIQSDNGVGFSHGVMLVDGRLQRPNQVQHWMSSNGISRYTTVEWLDPVTGTKRTSCNCPGWAHKKRDQKRSCCHTKDLEGTAACDKERVENDPLPIRTIADVRREVPTISSTRELRDIMLDNTE